MTELVAGFPALVELYDRTTPFTAPGQLDLHRQTVAIRSSHPAPSSAIADHQFVESLHATLQTWGIGVRASVLVSLPEFQDALRRWATQLDALSEATIDDPHLDSAETANDLWELIQGIRIVDNKARLVALSKTIHHILPDLLPPIDRAYTQRFFLWHSNEFQNEQEKVFRSMWKSMVRIARQVNPESFVGSGWRTSRTKVIDNAIVAYVKRETPSPTPASPRARRTPSPARLSDTHTVKELYDKLDEFERELGAADLKPNTIDTYVGRSKTFVDWLAGRYEPRGPNSST